jgi:predicted metalloprotease with PDZ domain
MSGDDMKKTTVLNKNTRSTADRLPKAKSFVHYAIVPKDLAGHLFAVTITLAEPDQEGQVFSLPAWIPGSYMIREFARHITQIEAHADGRKVVLEKLDKHTWKTAPCIGTLTVDYVVYAWDLSVRAAHLDQTHAFFNGSSVFLQAAGHEYKSHQVDILQSADPACRTWRIATTLPPQKISKNGFGRYLAPNYDALIDHPVETGNFVCAVFMAHDVPHEVVITGKVPNLDLPRLCIDLKKICETQIAFFEPRSKKAPMDRYIFMTMAVGDGYGGLEHRNSTALICNRTDLPVKGREELSEGYRTFLGLCSHEYFHTWNVKRIKPAAFAPYKLGTESYTPLLWLFEGFTSYYDDLMLLRSGIIKRSDYLLLLQKTVDGVLRGSGRHTQSVADSSYDAWTKYYRQDENASNAIVSYYTKGSLVALALDLTIRAETEGKLSLDDVMRALWQRYGKDFYRSDLQGQGVTPEGVEQLFDEVTGLKLRPLFNRWVRGTTDLPLLKLLVPFGLTLDNAQSHAKQTLGARTTKDAECRFVAVYGGSAAHKAGISTQDVLIAIDGLKITGSNLDSVLTRYRAGDVVEVHVFRRDELMLFKLKLQPDETPKTEIAVDVNATKPVIRLRDAWLGKA